MMYPYTQVQVPQNRTWVNVLGYFPPLSMMNIVVLALLYNPLFWSVIWSQAQGNL